MPEEPPKKKRKSKARPRRSGIDRDIPIKPSAGRLGHQSKALQEITKGDPEILQLYQLDELDREILRLLCEHPGISYEHIGGLLGITNSVVSKRANKPGFKNALSDVRDDTYKLLKKAQSLAVKRLAQILATSDNERNVIEAAKVLTTPLFNKQQIEVTTVSEVIHRVRFGEKGEVSKDTETIDENSTLALVGP